MLVLHVPHVRIIRHADLVVWAENEAGPFASKEPPHRLNLFRRRFLSGDVVVQAEDEQRIDVAQDAIVQRKFETRLVYPLEHWDRLTRDLADELLKWSEGTE